MTGQQYEKACNKCGDIILMQKAGDVWKALNKDFTPHKCSGAKSQTPAGAITGLLTGYNSASATFRVKGGATKTYALQHSIFTAWQTAGFGPDHWIEFTIDAQSFVQPGARNITAPEWAAELKDPTGGEIKKPFTKASELPKETPCTSPQAESPAAELSDEDRVRAAIMRLNPSDRVGCRISLAGMVNSVIEMEKLASDHPLDYANIEADVKRKAVAMFLWCDSLTTRAVQ